MQGTESQCHSLRDLIVEVGLGAPKSLAQIRAHQVLAVGKLKRNQRPIVEANVRDVLLLLRIHVVVEEYACPSRRSLDRPSSAASNRELLHVRAAATSLDLANAANPAPSPHLAFQSSGSRAFFRPSTWPAAIRGRLISFGSVHCDEVSDGAPGSHAQKDSPGPNLDSGSLLVGAVFAHAELAPGVGAEEAAPARREVHPIVDAIGDRRRAVQPKARP
eukprot:scaffold977_cov253-Pinguiococcus_pyrenoidosus.AAC.40